MSSMAYENLKDEKDNKKIEIDEEKFTQNFRSFPDLDEVKKGYEIGPLYPQADIGLEEIIKQVSEKGEYDSKWLV